jgi:hypothetical protein
MVDRMEGSPHYTSKAIQPWEAIEAWYGKDGFAFFLAGNVLKYVCRWRDKNGVDDLRKARHCLDRLIELETSESE